MKSAPASAISRLAILGLFSVAALGMLAPRAAQAATYTWNSTTTGALWSAAGSWTPASVPVFAAGDTFDLSTLNIAAATSSVMDTANTLGTIKIGDTDTTHVWTLSGTGILTLDGNGSAASINQVSTSKGDTISITTVKLNSNLGLTNSSANLLTISSGITSNTSGTKTITNSGTGAGGVSLNGIIGNGSGTVAIAQNSATSALTLGGANTFTGGVTVSSGSVILNSLAAAGTGTITVNGGTLSGQSSGTGLAAYTNAMIWNADFSLATPSKSNTFSGNITMAAPLTVTVVNNGSNTATISGSISSTNGIFDVTKAGTGTMIYNQAIALTSNQTSTVNAGILRLSGIISGSGFGVSNSGAGTLDLSGNNTYTGLTTAAGTGALTLSGTSTGSGGVTATSGTLNINNAAALGTGTLTIGSGATINNSTAAVITNSNNNAQAWNGNFTFTGTQSLNLGTGAVTLAAPLTTTITASTLTVGGVITTSGGTNNSIFDVTKAGAGTLLYTPNITLASAQTANVTAGTLALSGVVSGGFGLTVTGGGILSFTGATANASASAITASGGGIVAFDSSTAGVTGATRAASVTLKGGGLNVLGNSTVNSVDTITGALTTDIPTTVAAASANIVTLTPNAATNTQLVAGSLVHTANTAVFFRGTNLGANTIASATANTSNISFTTAPTAQLVGGGGAAGSKNISIIPWAVGDTSASGSGSSFVTYDANGIRPLASGEYDTALPAGASTNNVSLSIPTTTTVTVNGATTVNSLFLTGSPIGSVVTLAGTGPLTITSGALFINYGAPTGATTISKPLDFGSAQGFIGTNGVTSDSKGVFITGGISGSGGLVLYNSSAMIIGTSGVTLNTTASTYTGDTYIIGGASVGIDGAIPNGARTGDLYVYGRLSNNQSNGSSFTINGLNGTGTIAWDHSGNTRHFILGDNTSDASFSGTLIGGTALSELRKVGTNTQVLSGTANTYSGVTNIQNGTLSVVTLNSVTGGSATSTLGNPTTVANGTINMGSTTTTGTLKVVGTGETTDRVINLIGTTGGGTIDQSGTGLLKFTSSFTATGAGIKTLTLQGSTAGTGEISGAIVNNSGTNKTSVTKTGTGTWTLSGANTYTGTTSINGGNLQVAGTEIAGTSGPLGASGTISFGGGALQYSATNTFDYSSRFSNAASQAYKVDTNGQSVTWASALTSSGGSLTKAGTGTITLSAANSYSGGTTVSAGTLALSGAGTFGSSSLTVSGGTTDLGGANITNTLGALTGGGAVNNGTITNNSSNYDLQSGSVSAILAGSNTLTKSTGGTVTLNAANTYTGLTTISAGTLALGSSGSIAGSVNLGTFSSHGTLNLVAKTSGYTFSTGQTLAGFGTVDLGGTGHLLTIASGATLAPGNSPGIVNVNGNLALAGTTSMEIAGTATDGNSSTGFDQVIATGSLSLGGSLGITAYNSYSLTTTVGSYKLFTFLSETGDFASVTVAGTALNLNSGVWSNTVGGYDITFNESSGTLAVALASIPEPSTYAILVGAGLLFFTVSRRKIRQAS